MVWGSGWRLPLGREGACASGVCSLRRTLRYVPSLTTLEPLFSLSPRERPESKHAAAALGDSSTFKRRLAMRRAGW